MLIDECFTRKNEKRRFHPFSFNFTVYFPMQILELVDNQFSNYFVAQMWYRIQTKINIYKLDDIPFWKFLTNRFS